MIIAKIKDIKRYLICPEMENIIKYVESTELDRLSYGVYELFPNVVLSVDSYETHEETQFVGHEKSISIHIIVDGAAKYSYADFNDDSIAFVKQYDEELSLELAELDMEYDTMKTMYDTLLEEMRAQADSEKTATSTAAQDTGLLQS